MRLTKVGFESWLYSKSPRTKVGFVDELLARGPIVRYVEQAGVKLTGDVPAWVARFNSSLVRREAGRSVSASACLNVLNSL